MGLGTWKKRKSAIRNPSRRDVLWTQSAIGFTLVELLVVISIIALLVGILLPSIGKAREYAANTRTSARIAELAGGCNMYFTENGYYPGQRYADQLGSNPTKFTGSQWLAKSLFSELIDPNAVPPQYQYPRPKYAPLKAAEDLILPMRNDGTFDIRTISDRNTVARAVMPILYYPARPGVSGLTQYKWADNSTYTGGTATPFNTFITDTRFSSTSTTPYAPGAFLIIAAGMDRLYFTTDDICYPAFSGK